MRSIIFFILVVLMAVAQATPPPQQQGHQAQGHHNPIKWAPDMRILSTDPESWSTDMKHQVLTAIGAGLLGFYLHLPLMYILGLAGLTYGMHGLGTSQYAVGAILLWSLKTKNKIGLIASSWAAYCYYKGFAVLPHF